MPREILYLAGLLMILPMAFGAALFDLGPRPAVASTPILRCAAMVCLNWLAGMAYNWITGDHHAWAFNIMIDAITAIVVLSHPAGRWQAALGASYCLQLTMHVGYGLALIWSIADPAKYGDALTFVAWAQLLLVGGWSGGIWYQGYFRHRSTDRRPTPHGALDIGLDEAR